MALTQNDFLLTDEELKEINCYFSGMAESHAQAGEDAQQSVSVTFDFMPAFGRTVTARFDSEPNGQPISDEFEVQRAEATTGDAQRGAVEESHEQQLANHGFLISDDVQGSPEADELAKTFANVVKSMQDGKSDKG